MENNIYLAIKSFLNENFASKTLCMSAFSGLGYDKESKFVASCLFTFCKPYINPNMSVSDIKYSLENEHYVSILLMLDDLLRDKQILLIN